MKTDKPTPIPKRAHAPKSEPKPLVFPQPNRYVDVAPPLAGEELRTFVEACVAQALYTFAERQARALYKVVIDWPIAEIMTMGEEQFIALYRSVLEAE